MIRKLITILYSITGFFLTFGFLAHADIGCSFLWTENCSDPKKIEVGCQGDECSIAGGYSGVTNAVDGAFAQKTITEFTIDTVIYFLSFVTLIGVTYVIYAGFQIMIGGGDEEKIKKARQIIIYVLIGIIVMWAAYWIVTLILEALN